MSGNPNAFTGMLDVMVNPVVSPCLKSSRQT